MNPGLAERDLDTRGRPGKQDGKSPHWPGQGYRRSTREPRVAVGGDLPTRTIDSLVAKGDIQRVDFIKMDIEGSEFQR